MKEKKPVGAPRGNQNARKHGLYSRVLDEDQKLELGKARAVKGIDEEIAVMRVKLLTLLDKYPERIDLQMRAIATIARMVRTRLVICEAFDKCVLERLRRRNDEVGADRLLRRLRAPRNDIFGGGRT